MVDPWAGRKGIDILADIMAHMKPASCENLISNLNKQLPKVATELRNRLFTFERLAECDSRGMQLLLKNTSMTDLANALKGASKPVLRNIADNMSKRAIADLQEEIRRLGPTSQNEISAARERILSAAKELILARQMRLVAPNEQIV
ncbi:MAG: hypothetical protein HQM10_22055 [Candidatus Riflebacteria bacterium]|nr:hypothetical protein [Candidatus Riflebacteria bacterium]